VLNIIYTKAAAEQVEERLNKELVQLVAKQKRQVNIWQQIPKI
jgi:hypothetical protein